MVTVPRWVNLIALLSKLLIIWRRPMGWFEDMALLTTAVMICAPNLHNGYLLILVLMMTPLVRKYRIQVFYFSFGLLALLADMYKWPIENFQIALALMIGAFIAMILAMVWVRKSPQLAADRVD